MNEKLQEVNQLLERSAKEMNSLNSILASSIVTKKIKEQAEKSEIETEKETKEKLEKLSKQLGNAATGLINFAKGVQASAGSFAPLGDIILKAGDLTGGVIKTFLKKVPVLGAALDAGAKVLATVGSHMVNEFEKAYTTFERVSGSGIVSSFTMFEQSAASMNLTFADFDRVMTKSSKDLAILGGGALQGTKIMQQLGAGSYHLQNQFQKLGIGAAEVTEFQMSYLVQQQQLNKGRLNVDTNLIAASGEYVKELDLVAKLTGMTRKEADQNRKKMMEDSQIRANLIDMDPNRIKELYLLNDVLSAGTKNPQMATDIIKMITSGNILSNKELGTALAQGGVDPHELSKDFKSGRIGVAEATKKVAEAMKKFSDSQIRLTQLGYGESNKLFGYTVESENLMTYSRNLTQEMIDKFRATQDAQTKETEGLNSDLAKSKRSLYNASQRLEKLSVSSDIMAAGMKHVSRGLYALIDKANEMAGIKNPPHIEAFKELLKVEDKRTERQKVINNLQEQIKENLSVQSKLTGQQLTKNKNNIVAYEKLIEKEQLQISTLNDEVFKKQQLLIKAEIEAGLRSSDDTTTTAPSSGTQPTTSSQTNSSTTASTSGQNNTSTDYSGLNIRQDPKVNGVPEVIAGGASTKKAIDLAKKIQQQYPGVMFTGLNDTYNRGPNSSHAKGRAVDFVLPGRPANISVEDGKKIVGNLKGMGASFALDEYNTKTARQTGKHIHAEVSARTGGIFSGPSSGYLAELHGDEAVVSSDVSKKSLNSEVSAMTNPSAARINLNTVYEDLSDKLEQLVKLMKDQNSAQKKYIDSEFG